MNNDLPVEASCSKTWIIARHADAVRALCQAMKSMPGRSQSALLRDVYEIARSKFGFDGTIDDAILVLQSASEVRLEPNDEPERTRVFLIQER